MDFYVLSPPEAAGLYLGLAQQAQWRASSLAVWIPYFLLTAGVIGIIWRETAEGLRPVRLGLQLAAYLGISLTLCVLFWPEILGLGDGPNLSASQVTSYAASQDGDATVVTAADTGLGAQRPVFVTPGFRLLLSVVTETPLAMARLLNQQVHRSFSPIIGMSWLLGLELTADVTRALTDWVEACWKPSIAQDQEFQQAIQSKDLLPWGDSLVAQALATREAVPGAMTGRGYLRTNSPLGLAFLANPGSPRAVRCDVYLRAVEADVQRWLYTSASPNGMPLSQVFQEDLGLTVEDQARFLIYREASRALGRPSPAPSLGGAYTALTGARTATGALSGALQPRGGWLGALFGMGQAATGQVDRVMDAMLFAVGLAMWAVYWAPFVAGMALQVLVGLFSIVFAYSLLAQRQFRPLITYSLALLYVCCTPLWFALVDLSARAAAPLAPQSQDMLLALFNGAPALFYSTVVTVLGLFFIPLLGAGLLFQTARGMIASWRG